MFIVCHSPQGFMWILNPSTALWGGGVYYYSHFTVKETEAQIGSLAQGRTQLVEQDFFF